MEYLAYKTGSPREATLALINTADDIIREYSEQGYTLTLRQLYYQFVARDIIPNTERSYKNLGSAITKGREFGLLPWDGIEDRNRGKKGWHVQESISAILAGLPAEFAADFWKYQPRYIEVWVEKEALASIVEKACRPLRVPFMSCKGYLSASEAWAAGVRMEEARSRGQDPLVIHLGDHDPSGIDMTRDNEDRLSLYSWGDVEVRRIALNMDQVEEYSPPPNPAKLSDSRASDYVSQFGGTSWELDALEPSVLVDLIQSELDIWVSRYEIDRARDLEVEQRELLRGVSRHWDDITALIKKLDQ